MLKIKSWEVSDSFWSVVEPLIPPPERDPKKEYRQKEWWWAQTDRIKNNFCRYHVCSSNRVVSGKPCQKNGLAVPEPFTPILRDGSIKDFFLALWQTMMIWKEEHGNGKASMAL